VFGAGLVGLPECGIVGLIGAGLIGTGVIWTVLFALEACAASANAIAKASPTTDFDLLENPDSRRGKKSFITISHCGFLNLPFCLYLIVLCVTSV
jgi:hypothetical protein